MPRRFAIRKSDGAVFEPSTPEGYTAADAVAEALSGESSYYFRRVEPTPWWMFWKSWRRTGEVWEPEADEFTVTTNPKKRGD